MSYSNVAPSMPVIEQVYLDLGSFFRTNETLIGHSPAVREFCRDVLPEYILMEISRQAAGYPAPVAATTVSWQNLNAVEQSVMSVLQTLMSCEIATQLARSVCGFDRHGFVVGRDPNDHQYLIAVVHAKSREIAQQVILNTFPHRGAPTA